MSKWSHLVRPGRLDELGPHLLGPSWWMQTFGEPQAAEVLVLEVNLYYKEKIDKFLPVKVRLIA